MISDYFCLIFYNHTNFVPIPVATHCKAWVCGRLAGVAGSSPAGNMDGLSLVSVVCCQKSLRRADHSSGGVLPSVLCLIVIYKSQQ
jgi:hypothetical protein